MKYDFGKKGTRVEFIEKNGVKVSAKIHYVFVDGTQKVIEVSVKDGEVMNALLKEEEKSDRKQRRFIKFYYDLSDELANSKKADDGQKCFEGEMFVDPNPNPEEKCELEEEQSLEEKRIEEFKSTLTPVQLRRLNYRLKNPNISLRELAEKEGVAYTVVYRTFEQIQKKYKNFFK